MGNLLQRFKPDEPDWAALRSRAVYPELIGRTAPAGDTVPFMKCDCGMLVLTTRELHGQRTVCNNCEANAKIPDLATQAHAPVLGPRNVRRVHIAVAIIVLALAALLGRAMGSVPTGDDSVTLD